MDTDKKTAIALGLNSILDNGQHLVMLDYDGKPIEDVMQDASHLKMVYGLGPFELVKSLRGYHAIFWWTPVKKELYDEILRDSKCDIAFSTAPKKTIRIAGKYDTPDLLTVAIVRSPGEEIGQEGMDRLNFAHNIADSVQINKDKLLKSRLM